MRSVTIAAVAVAADRSLEAWRQWRQTARLAHPMAGLVVDAHGRETGSTDGIIAGDLAKADFLLLGEVHDNPAHPRIRAWIIGGVADRAAPKRPALIFEHIDADRQAVVDTALATPGATPDDLFAAVDWERSGWPSRSIFAPLFEVAIAKGLPVVGGNAPKTEVRKLARGGLATIPEAERTRLAIDAPLEPALHDALLADLEASHCGVMPRSSLGGLALAQRYRDASMAAAMIAAQAGDGGAILLAGNGHVRSDRGVPWHLRRIAPGRRIASVMLIEVEDGKLDPAAYFSEPGRRAPADAIIFTPRAVREDPCIAMRRQFEKK